SELLRDRLPEGWELRDLGRFTLKDLGRPEAVSQLAAPGLRGNFPALKSLDRQPHNLPLLPGAFIGREREMLALRAAFASCADAGGSVACRLLTLVGPGGAGKTRLAVQAGAELIDEFEGGVWFVDLSACTEAEGTARAVNRALGVREGGGRSAEALERHLGTRRVLLILDNLEQDHEAVGLVAELLSACPGLAVLATSREGLKLRWERLLPLSSLGLPEPGAAADLERLRHYEAVTLFLDRAAQARPSFAINSRNAPAVAELCLRLDGIPLAIELAAARLKAFSVEEILERMEADLGFLDSGGSDLPARHRTLRAVAQWSYNILGKAEKTAFRALGSFGAGFTLDSAEALLAAVEGRARQKLPEDISSLVEKSLLVREEEAGEGEGETRYRMLESLRAYARERLEAGGEAQAVYDAHAERFLALAAGESRSGAGHGGAGRSGAGHGGGQGGGQGDTEARRFRRIDREYADYRAALERFLAAGEASKALRLATGLGGYWLARAAFEEGTELLRRVLAGACAAAGEGTSAADGAATASEQPFRLAARRCRASIQLAALLRGAARLDEAFAALDGARGLLEAEGACDGDPGLAEGDLRRELAVASGWTLQAAGRAAEAKLAFESALCPDGGEAKSGRALASARHGLGALALNDGRLEEARGLLVAAREGYRRAGDEASVARAANVLGLAELRRGDRRAALRSFAASAAALRANEDWMGYAAAANNLACLAADGGDQAAALEGFAEAETVARSRGLAGLLVAVLVGQAESLLALGRIDEAAAKAEEADERSSPWGAVREAGWSLRVRAAVARSRGDEAVAAELFKRAERVFTAAGDAAEAAATAAAAMAPAAAPPGAPAREPGGGHDEGA
ncbi:MAG: hypothetical protein JNG85_04810, partial [Spirochaetaceae bacterium]|nr:hypothetical protein [Spirochaetaceae bacterium]